LGFIFAHHKLLWEISTMKQTELLAFAKDATRCMKTQKDLSYFCSTLKKVIIESVLCAEFDNHLGYDKHQPSIGSNSRNDHSNKTFYTDDQVIQIDFFTKS
jgi:putative transposase